MQIKIKWVLFLPQKSNSRSKANICNIGNAKQIFRMWEHCFFFPSVTGAKKTPNKSIYKPITQSYDQAIF